MMTAMVMLLIKIILKHLKNVGWKTSWEAITHLKSDESLNEVLRK